MENFEKYSKEQLIQEIQSMQKKITEFEEGEEKYKAMFENAPLSYQSLDEDGNFLDVNPTWLKTLGYQKNEVIGQWFGDFLRADYIDHFKKNFPEFKKAGSISDVQFYLRKKNGDDVYVSFEGSIAYTPDGKFKQTYCTFEDITKEYENEKALIESEEKFRSFFEANEAVMLEVDSETKKIINCNKKAIEYYGFKKEDLLNKSMYEINVLEPHEIDKKMITALKQKSYSAIIKQKLFSGEIRDVMVYASSVKVLDKKNMFVMTFDISEQKLAEQALKENEEKFRTLVTSMNDLVFVFDENKRFTYFHASESQEVYLKPEEFLGKTISEVLPSYIIELFDKAFSVVKKGKAHRFEYFLEIQGEIKWYSLNLSPIFKNEKFSGAIAVARNITENKRYEEAVIKSRKELELIIDKMPGLMAYVNAKLEYIYVNKPYADFYGMKREHFIGVHVKKILPAVTYKNAEPHFKRAMAGEEFSYENSVTATNGKNKTVQARYIPHFNDENNLIAFLAVVEDITERKENEEELSKYRVKLEELVKERTVELQKTLQEVQRMNELFVGREFRIKELKNEIEFLKTKQN